MTLVFWLLACFMIGLALFAVLRPLLRSRVPSAPGGDGLRLAAYEARLAEIEEDVAGGMLSEEEARSVRLETERELLRAVELKEVHTTGGIAHPARWAAAILLIVMPVVSLLLYLYLGQPSLIDTSAPLHPDGATLERMVQQLAARLRDDPGDALGWRLLARSYATLGRNEEAVAALEHIHKLKGDDPEIMVELAQALAAMNEGRYAGRPVSLLEGALAFDPQHREALWLAGTAAMETGDADRAVAHWERLVPLMDSAETADEVRRLIARVQGESGSALAGSDAGQEDVGPFTLRVKVELSPELAGEAVPDAVVFITARAPDGPPMPLAVVRRPAKELPFEITLDQSSAMLPNVALSDFERLDLSARISRSGQAERQSGDLIGELRGVRPGVDGTVSISIGTRLP